MNVSGGQAKGVAWEFILLSILTLIALARQTEGMETKTHQESLIAIQKLTVIKFFIDIKHIVTIKGYFFKLCQNVILVLQHLTQSTTW